MHALKARVRHGRIVVDEPTDLPEGTELDLVRADELELEDRESLLRAIREGIADADAGRVVDDAEARKRLEAKFGPLAS